jgi:aminopeptidase N
VVVIEYSGKITDGMHGLYPCYYDHDGSRKKLFATQFESHHAREAFPCVDEPAAKATYDVTLTTQPGLTILGNMPIDWQREENGLLISAFQTTPRMSTYLLAWVVGELHKKTAATKRGIEVNVWATPAQPRQTLDFALDIATRSIDFYESYFGVEYPLPKSDHVALPDFSSGAMENWGLITYRESCLLADPQLTPVASKRSIATVITHELSHQWFGNLVTMQWWNDLWLNESFANLMEYVAVDALEPDWHIWEDYARSEVVAALRRDSLDGVQSVQTEVNHPDEISTLFDGAIVYAKGGRLLRMVKRLIGDEAFRAGLKAYFTEHAYHNTVGDNLWCALETASGKPITALMNQWISQPGFPLVTVGRAGDEATLEQTRFFVGEHKPSDTQWSIPLFATPEGLGEMLDEPRKVVHIEGGADIQLNHDLSAHFVAKYDEQLRARLLERAANGELSTLDKIGLLQDIPLLANFARPTYEQLGWDAGDGESDGDRERRASALSLMMYGEDEAVLEEAKRRFDTQRLEKLSPELRASIISAAVRHFETPELVDQLFEMYRSTPSNDLQMDIMLGLTSTQNAATTKRILAAIQDSTIIRPQDATYWFVYLIRMRDSREITWNWLKDNWTWIEETYKGDKSYDDFARYSAGALLTRAELEEYRAYFDAKRDEPALTRTIDLGIREIAARVELIERDRVAVIERLGAS